MKKILLTIAALALAGSALAGTPDPDPRDPACDGDPDCAVVDQHSDSLIMPDGRRAHGKYHLEGRYDGKYHLSRQAVRRDAECATRLKAHERFNRDEDRAGRVRGDVYGHQLRADQQYPLYRYCEPRGQGAPLSNYAPPPRW